MFQIQSKLCFKSANGKIIDKVTKSHFYVRISTKKLNLRFSNLNKKCQKVVLNFQLCPIFFSNDNQQI